MLGVLRYRRRVGISSRSAGVTLYFRPPRRRRSALERFGPCLRFSGNLLITMLLALAIIRLAAALL